MLQLQQVLTRPRRRISADEEERNRVGYDLRTTYRFALRSGKEGHVPERLDALIGDGSSQPLGEITYADSAEIRVVNLGRRGRANKDVLGFNLDLIKGRWLPDHKGAPEGEDDEFEARLEDVATKDRVIPYVEDRRNIAIVRWSNRMDDETAVTLQYALERGMEACFQLEDSELGSELLPDGDERGRVLLIEAAEGGAGVLRRLQSEPDAIARAAREALTVMHVDPDTGTEAEDSCVRGCYRCLLTYGNQTHHEMIDRRLAVPVFLRLASGSTAPISSTSDDTANEEIVIPSDASPAVTALLEHLRAFGLRGPDGISNDVEGMTVDLVFQDRRGAVIIEEVGKPAVDSMALLMSGWNVVRIAPGDDLDSVIRANPTVFGGVA